MQVLLNGITTGATIGLLALSFSVVYLSTRIFHVALAGIYAVVPLVTWSCLQIGWPVAGAALVGCLAGVGLSLACEYGNHAPLERKDASPNVHLIASLGIYIVLVQVAVLSGGSETKVLRQGTDVVFDLSLITLPRSQLIAAAAVVAILLTFFGWLRFSKMGLQIRALADNPRALALQGYNLRRLRLTAFGISGLLASSSALVVAYDLGFSPHDGFPALLLAVVAMIIGGSRSFIGPVLGGILLGVVRAEITWFLSTRWEDMVSFLFLSLFLYIRPRGVIGWNTRLEVQT